MMHGAVGTARWCMHNSRRTSKLTIADKAGWEFMEFLQMAL